MAMRSLVIEERLRRRNEFAVLVRNGFVSGRDEREVGRRDFSLSDADIDQAVADAFNPYKSLPGSPATASSQSQVTRPDVRRPRRTFDPLLIIAIPFAFVNAVCAFVLLCAFNVCIAIKKTIRGESV